MELSWPRPGNRLPAFLRKIVREITWRHAGIVRNAEGLKTGLKLLLEIVEESNLLSVARIIHECALAREESRGAHFREDFPGVSTNVSFYVLQRKAVEESETGREPRQAARQDQDADRDDEGAADHFDRVEVFFETAVEAEETVKRDAREKERDAQARGIDGQQEHSCPTFSFVLAIAIIAARIGPMHGVQPNAKASPNTSAPTNPRGFSTLWNRLSR